MYLSVVRKECESPKVHNMPITLNGETCYRTAEACQIAGIGKNTFFRWVRKGLFADLEHRDRRGWRLFTKYELDRLRADVNRVENKER